jgi:hypothetical protein
MQPCARPSSPSWASRSPLRRDRDAVPNSELQHGLCHQRRSEARWAYLRCDILSGLKPKPKRTCRLDLTGFQLGPRGRATVVCAGDTAVNTHARVLRYGSKWSRGGFTCTSRKAGLRCRNPGGHGFLLSRAHSYRF